mmetsp:Transcript_17706/g.30968  ORF Transcript_17706/g.30968 Transcript_17706/m.30968 type:complete len:480 (-) Transcript_17706:130-1569(-)
MPDLTLKLGEASPGTRSDVTAGTPMTVASDMSTKVLVEGQSPDKRARSNWKSATANLKQKRWVARVRARSILAEDDLPEEAIEDLAALRMAYWKKNQSEHEGKRIDDSLEAMSAIWGSAKSWTVVGEVPGPNKFGIARERPLLERDLKHWPADSISGKDLLQTVGVGAMVIKGKKGATDFTLGQDNLSVSRLDNGWEVYCIMDGHGPDGHWPSQRGVNAMPFYLQQAECSALLAAGKVEQALHVAFEQTQRSMEHHGWEEKIKLFISGTTASVVLRHPDKSSVWVATTGDSRVVMLAPGAGVMQLTQDHTPLVQVELDRVQSSGCELECQTHDDGCVERRIFLKGKKYPGIAMTRSLGDLCVKGSGVTAIPEVVEWPFQTGTGAMILVASDGVWEFLKTEDVGRIVLRELGRNSTPKETLAKLFETAKARWAEEEDNYCDDISAVLVPLDMPGLPAVPVPPRDAGMCLAGVCRAGCTLS